jgi:ABC-2 type transport system permease protein
VHKVWAVIRREFIERVRTKWFLISTILGPVFMIAMTVLPALLTAKTGRVNSVVLADEGSGTLAERLRTQLGRTGRFDVSRLAVEPGRAQAVTDSLTAQVQVQGIDGFLVISGATLESGSVEYRGRNVSSIRDMAVLDRALRQAVLVERLTRRGIDPAVVQEAQGRIDLKTLRITKRGATGESGEATFFLAYIIGLVMYMVITLYSVNVMRSVLEEKQTRIIEVLVSSMRPFQLMLGKVVGVGGVGLFQFGIWASAGYALVHYKTAILGLFKVPADQVASIQLPAVGAELVAVALVYFLLGYLLYSAMFAVVGASVNADSEAQQAQQPVLMLLIASLLVLFPVLNDPGGRMAVVASLVPFSAPIIMPIRVAASEVPTTELAASLAILGASMVFVVWGSARIYRIGILMYGKRPSMKEMLRWARQS